MLEGLKRYRRFPLIDSGSALLNTASWQLPAFLLAAFFSPVVVGFYSLSFMVLQLPMSLIGSSIAQVFFQRAAEARSDGTLSHLVENVFRLLIMIGIFPILTVTIIGPDLFAVVFGENWTEAGVYAQILSVWAFVWFISSPLSTIWAVLEKQTFGMRVTTLNFVTRVASLVLGGMSGSPVVALSLFAGSGVLVYGYLNVKMMLFSGVRLIDVRKHVLSVSGCSLCLEFSLSDSGGRCRTSGSRGRGMCSRAHLLPVHRPKRPCGQIIDLRSGCPNVTLRAPLSPHQQYHLVTRFCDPE